jgi:alpha-galactosidase
MKQTCRIVLIGAGSREFSRGLIHDLVLASTLLKEAEVSCVLVDTAPERLQETLTYARECIALTEAQLAVSATTDREQALPGADFVLISIATHRMDLWEQDFRIPLSYGFRHVYGENGGPGAMFHALRNLNIVMPICRDIERLAPEAVVLNFTNPEARVLTAIRNLTSLRAYGLCHGFHDFYRFASGILQRPIEELEISTAGMNHFITFCRISDRNSGADLIPEFHRQVTAQRSSLQPLVRFMYENFGVFGLDSDRHIGEYVGFAHELADTRWEFGIENREVLPDSAPVSNDLAFDAWRHKMDIRTYMRSDLPAQSALRPAAERSAVVPSGELAVPIISAMVLDEVFRAPSVNTLNGEGYIENLSLSGCIEVPASVDRSGIHPEHIGALPEAFAAMIRTQHSIQQLIVEAFRTGSRALLYQALLLDPTVDSPRRAEQMLQYMLEVQSEYLPQFS